MAKSLQNYARMSVLVNGTAITDLISVTHKTESGQQTVFLLNEGLGGFTPGSGSCHVDLEFAVPIKGPNSAFQQDCAVGAFATLQINVGAQFFVGAGKYESAEFSTSVNSSVSGKVSWIGELKPMEAS